MNEIEYQEIFTKSEVPTNSIDYILNAIAEAHPAEYGWTIGEPEIIKNSDGRTVTIKVPLTKYRVERGNAR